MRITSQWTVDLGDDRHLGDIQPDVGAFLDDNGVVGRAGYVSRLVIEEIVRNLIDHSARPSAAGTATVEISVTVGEVEVVIEDDGEPFDPADGPRFDPTAPLDERRAGGMGLHLVRTMADTLAYGRVGERNRLTITVARESGDRPG